MRRWILTGPFLALLAGSACDGGAPVVEGEWPVGLSADPAQECVAPLASAAWVESGEALGLAGASNPDGDHTAGGTVALDDLDGDGLLDVYVGQLDVLRLFLGNGESFDETESTPLANGREVGTFSLGDLDGDGSRDLIFAAAAPWFGRASGGAMQRTALDLGGLWDGEHDPDTSPGMDMKALLPADLDADGVLDLYQLMHDSEFSTDRVLHGLGGMEYASSAEESDPTGLRVGFDATWFDWDVDGDLDIYVIQDRGSETGGNQLFENRDGLLVDRSADCACGLEILGMGGAAGDYNRDGFPDLYLSSTDSNVLLAATGSGEFVDVTQAVGADPVDKPWRMGWGGIFADLDNDGWLDVVAAMGDHWPTANPEEVQESLPVAVLMQEGGVLLNRTVEMGLDREGSWRSVLAHDVNEDGVLDLLVTDAVLAPSLYMSTGCTEASWLEVYGPVGARVEVSAGGQLQTGWIESQSSLGAARVPSVHFGLGGDSQIDALAVVLPDGERIERTTPFEGRRRLRVTENP